MRYLPRALALALTLCMGVAMVASCGSGTGAGQAGEALPRDPDQAPPEEWVLEDIGPTEEFNAQESSIAAELANVKNHQWAGKYETGPDFGREILHLAPDGHFTLYESGCTASFGYTGIAYRVPGGFQSSSDYHFFNSKLFFVQWENRRYIIPEYLMEMFVDDVNSGWLMRLGRDSYLLRSDSYDQTVTGVPQLPEPYGSMIRSTPLEPRMISLRIDAGKVLLVFDKGSVDGLSTEMKLRNPATRMRAEITRVLATSCEAVLGHLYENSRDEVLATLQSPAGEKWTERVWN